MTVESDNFFPVRRPEVAARSEPFANHDPRAVWRVLRGLVRARLGDEHVGPSGAVDNKAPYTTAPSASTSLRAVLARSPIACSGLMYAGVPSESPVCVRRCPPAPADEPYASEPGKPRRAA